MNEPDGRIKDNSPDAEAARALAKMVYRLRPPANHDAFVDYLVALEQDGVQHQMHNVYVSNRSGWLIRSWVKGKQRTLGYFSRDNKVLAMIGADIVQMALWPIRREYRPDAKLNSDLLNFPPVLIEEARVQDEEFNTQVTAIFLAFENAIKVNGWGSTIVHTDDGEVKIKRSRTLTQDFINFKIQWEEVEAANSAERRGIIEQLKQLNDAAKAPVATAVASGDDARNLFEMHHQLEVRLTELEQGQQLLLRRNDELASKLAHVLDALDSQHQDHLAIRGLLASLRDEDSRRRLLDEVNAACRDNAKERAVHLLAKLPRREPYVECPGCHNLIDSEVCHCGEEIAKHDIGCGHSPVPMGCTCGYLEQETQSDALVMTDAPGATEVFNRDDAKPSAPIFCTPPPSFGGVKKAADDNAVV